MEFRFVEQVLDHLRLSGCNDREQYAEMLDSGQTDVVPLELCGVEVSHNGLCDWDKKKAFINEHKHKISFEVVSKVFEDPPPRGFQIVDDGWNSYDWNAGMDREYVLAKIASNLYLVIRTQGVGSLIRLISARLVKTHEAEKIVVGNLKQYPGMLTRSIAGMYNDDGTIRQEARLDKTLMNYLMIYSNFCNRRITSVDAKVALTVRFGIPIRNAAGFVDTWKRDRREADARRGDGCTGTAEAD